MTHLTEPELVDLVDGVLPEARRAHIQDCAACQARAADIDWALVRASEAMVPEPSPLFWDHLSARIREAVASPEVAARPERAWCPRVVWALGLGSLACVVALSLSMRGPAAPRATSAVVGDVPAGSHSPNPESLLADDVEADQAWAVVRVVADRVAWADTEAAGISPGPDAAERITLGLSTTEQAALAELLQRELGRAGT